MTKIKVLEIVPNMQQGGLENLIMNIIRNIDRSKKSTTGRLIKTVALSLGTFIIIWALVINAYTPQVGSHAPATVEDLQNGDYAQEVNFCLTVQQCTENNSVNSANICILNERGCHITSSQNFYLYGLKIYIQL